MCGATFDPDTVPVLLARPKGKRPCSRCTKICNEVMNARRRAREARRARAAAGRPGPDLGSLRVPRWVVRDERGGPRAHRPNPAGVELGAMCGVRLPVPLTVLRWQPPNVPVCQRCTKKLYQARVDAGLATVHVADPEQVDRLDRARDRGVSIRTVRGGLPTLGRDR
jgi:hypothetical protein